MRLIRPLIFACAVSASSLPEPAWADRKTREWKWDKMVQTQCKLHMPLGWDWLIFRALIKQESQFDPDAVSWCGAAGLTQIMPGTARELGMRPEDRFVPRLSINGGVRYLRRVWNIWGAERDGEQGNWERTRFALGSYNAGPGTVLRGQEYAGRTLNLPTDKWASIDQALRHVQKRWQETTTYVRKIFAFYGDYKAERRPTIFKAKKPFQFKARKHWIAVRAAEALKKEAPADDTPPAAPKPEPQTAKPVPHPPPQATTPEAEIPAQPEPEVTPRQTPKPPSPGETSADAQQHSQGLSPARVARWLAFGLLAFCALGILRLALVKRRA